MHDFKEINRAFERFLDRNLSFPENPSTLFDPCRDTLSAGGKRIRPALCLMSAELFGDLSDDIFNAATAIELFHNFTLIHDDIMDRAPLRRGKPTVFNKYGDAVAILSGDVVNIYAYDYLRKVREDKLALALKLFNKAAIDVCVGQQMDMDFESRDVVRKEEYLQMISLKTAALLALSGEMGALLNDADEERRALVAHFCKSMGIAFQLQDDYLDAFGCAEKTGKVAGGDIISEKKTYLHISCKELANSGQLRYMDTLADLSDNERVAATLSLYRTLKVDELSKQQIDHYTNESITALDQLGKMGSDTRHLEVLIKELLNREN